tara:strand:+ start:124 stop:798 length:675 start_codon:yes stop_codon:yes gene_type:complete
MLGEDDAAGAGVSQNLSDKEAQQDQAQKPDTGLACLVMPALLLEQYRIFRASPSGVTEPLAGATAGQNPLVPPKGGRGATSNMTGQPLGVALWAYLSPEAEEKLTSGGSRLRPDEWAVGMTLGVEGGENRRPNGSEARATARPSLYEDSQAPAPEANKHAYGVRKQEGGALWLVDLICPFHTPENKMADQMLADLIQGPLKGKKFKFHHTDPATGQRKVMELGG